MQKKLIFVYVAMQFELVCKEYLTELFYRHISYIHFFGNLNRINLNTLVIFLTFMNCFGMDFQILVTSVGPGNELPGYPEILGRRVPGPEPVF